jgi:hypothetical protein
MVGAQDGGMERQRNLILPERPQRGYWQFLYKYPKYQSVFGSTHPIESVPNSDPDPQH